MSDLASLQLKQAISFARAGNHDRAVELLEKARILAGNEAAVRAQILEELAREYSAVGRFEEAGRCREQLGPSNKPVRAAPPKPMSQPLPLRHASLARAAIAWGVMLLVLGSALAIGWRLLGRSSHPQLSSVPVVAPPTTRPATNVLKSIEPAHSVDPVHTPVKAPSAINPLVAATQPSAAPAVASTPAPKVVATPKPAPVVIAEPKPIPVAIVTPKLAPPPPPAPAPAIKGTAKSDRQELLRQTVGMCVVVVRYEGLVDGESARIDLPMGSGTAFCINDSGLMLTNRHVVDIALDEKIPANLKEAHLPTLTRRGYSYVVCFGADAKDRFPAKVLHKSEDYDMAILKIDRPCPQPLMLSMADPRQGDDILVCGFPGAVMEALNAASATPARMDQVTAKWKRTRHIEPFDDFSPDSFNSTLTRGIVSSPERHVEGANYAQIDATISPGNSGGPVLNLDNEVIGIATWHLRQSGDSEGALSYNFALRVGQLIDEIRPYLRGS